MLITSRDNARVKEIRSLRTRKAREEMGLYFIEGVRMVAEAIDAGAEMETLVVCEDLLDKYADELQRFQDRVQRAEAVPRLEVSAKVFESIAEYETSEGIGAVVRERWERMENVRLSDELCWIAVNSIQNPSNLGTLLRISDAVGGRGLALIGNCTDPYHPIAVRASLGAVFSQSVVRTSFAEFAGWKTRHGYRMVGTSPTAPLDYRPSPTSRRSSCSSETNGSASRTSSSSYAICWSRYRWPVASNRTASRSRRESCSTRPSVSAEFDSTGGRGYNEPLELRYRDKGDDEEEYPLPPPPAGEIRNSNIEIRNKTQRGKREMLETPSEPRLEFAFFVIGVCFEFRISCFEFWIYAERLQRTGIFALPLQFGVRRTTACGEPSGWQCERAESRERCRAGNITSEPDPRTRR
jgi:TrmH family RNA methyltransferase